MPDTLEEIREEIRDIWDWTNRHEASSIADKNLLNTLLESLQEHTHNSHGLASKAKSVGYTSALVALLSGFLELLRRVL